MALLKRQNQCWSPTWQDPSPGVLPRVLGHSRQYGVLCRVQREHGQALQTRARPSAEPAAQGSALAIARIITTWFERLRRDVASVTRSLARTCRAGVSMRGWQGRLRSATPDGLRTR